MTFSLRVLSLIAVFAVPYVHAEGAHWSYHGEQGPDHWGQEGSPLCRSGDHQSPIDISAVHHALSKADSRALQLNYGKSAVTLVNNGHTIQATPGPMANDWITYRGTVYQLAQFHFHTPSEHSINHQRYPMELHLVNKASNGDLLVIGLMLAEGKQNAELASLTQALPARSGETFELDRAHSPDLSALIPENSHHYFYQGSLTTPPCSEGVQWVLFDTPVQLSKEQIERFARIIGDNHRPLQNVNGREVDED
ncbi:carbonic anhydrase [Pseudomonas nitritireducens]|uniref:Carbonic anhydrase n=1 Tax=Pseudomonas nitroreducens TaxID=46680 RepID=A0A7W7P2T3_PSENT|nr:carbonic anhydrase family protein [Pseudomonas nitritireducens]MBB4866273.1 carbonic anhydrase [Pseudomonas nitritireducens]